MLLKHKRVIFGSVILSSLLTLAATTPLKSFAAKRTLIGEPRVTTLSNAIAATRTLNGGTLELNCFRRPGGGWYANYLFSSTPDALVASEFTITFSNGDTYHDIKGTWFRPFIRGRVVTFSTNVQSVEISGSAIGTTYLKSTGLYAPLTANCPSNF